MLYFVKRVFPNLDGQAHVVRVNEGDSATLPCGDVHHRPHPTKVVMWLRKDKGSPVFIKIGRYSPNIDESFKGDGRIPTSNVVSLVFEAGFHN